MPRASEDEEQFWSEQRARQAKHAPLRSPKRNGCKTKPSKEGPPSSIIRVTLVDEVGLHLPKPTPARLPARAQTAQPLQAKASHSNTTAHVLQTLRGERRGSLG